MAASQRPAGLLPVSASSRRCSIFLLTRGNNLERAVRQRPLQLAGLVPGRAHPGIALLFGSQNDRHRPGMHAAHLGIRPDGQKRKNVGGDLAFFCLPFSHGHPPAEGYADLETGKRVPVPLVRDAAPARPAAASNARSDAVHIRRQMRS